MTLSEVPKWAWFALAGVVVLALLARKSSAAPVSVLPGQMHPPADPNVEATNQTAITARAGNFNTLTDALFGYKASVSGNVRDVNIAAISGNAATEGQYFGASAQAISDYYEAVRTGQMEYGAERRTQILSDAATRQVELSESGATTRQGLSETGMTARTGLQSAAQREAAMIAAQVENARIASQQAINESNDRTRAAIELANAAARRKESTDNAVTSGLKTVCNGVVGFLTFGLAHC